MQVTNHSVSRQLNDSHSRINLGDLTSVIVKDRLSAREANVVIKGQEYKAEFQGNIPASDRMMAEVVGTPEKGKVILRQTEIPVKVNASASQNVESRIAQAGIDPAKNPDLKNAVRILEGKSVPLNKEQLLNLHKFIQEASGTPGEKIESIRVVAQKNLPVTPNHLNSIHNALHGQNLKDTLLNLIDGKQLDFEVPRPKDKTNTAGLIKEVRQSIQTEPDIQKAINQLKQQILDRPDFDAKTKQQVERAVTESNRLLSAGQPGIAKGNLVQSLVTVENSLEEEKVMAVKADRPVTSKPSEAIQSISKTVERAVQQIKSGANPLNELGEVLKSAERSSSNPQQLKQEIAKAQQIVDTARNQQASSETSKAEAIKEVRQSIQTEPNVQKAINHVKNQILESPTFDVKTKQQVERAVTESNRLLSAGQPGLAKGQLVQSLVTLENTMAKETATATKLDAANKPAEPIQSISKTVERAVQQIKNGANPLHEVGEILKSAERSTNNPQQLKQEITKAQQVIETATKEQQPVRTDTSKAEAIKEVRQSIQTEQNVQKVINHVKQQVLESPSFDAKTKQQVERAVSESNRILSAGQPGLAKGQLVQSLVTLENNMAKETATATKLDAANKPSEPIQSISKTVERAVQQIKNGANPLNEIGEVLKSAEKSSNNPQQLKLEIAKAQQVIETAPKQQPVNSETSKAEAIKEVRQSIQTEPNAQKAINHVKDQVLENPSFDPKTKQQVERAVTESNRLLSTGQPGMAKGHLVQSLVTVENSLAADKLMAGKANGSVTNKQVEPQQSISKTVERVVQQIKSGANPLNELGEVLKSAERSSNNPEQLKQEITKAQLVIETAKQQPVNSASKAEAIKEIRQAVQAEPNAQKAINHVKSQVLENPSFDAKTKQQVERAVTESNRLLSASQPGLAKGQLVQSLVKVENSLEAEKAMPAKADGSITNKTVEPQQSISKTVERAVQQIKSGANPLTEIGEVLKSAERSSNNTQQLKQEIAKAQQVIETAKQQPVSSDTSKSEVIKEVRQSIQTEPNTQRAINHVKTQILESPNFDAKTKQQVERAVTESNRLLSANQPGMAKGQLVQSLVTLENNLASEKAVAAKVDASVPNKPSEPIQSISKTVERAVQQIKSGANPLTEIGEVLKSAERSTNNPQQFKQEVAKAQQVIETAPKQQQPVNAETSKVEAVKEVRQAVQAEPNAQKAINHVKSQVLENPSFDAKTKQQVERAVTESNRLLSAGQPGMAKGHLVQSMVTVENSLAADKLMAGKANGSVTNKQVEPQQSISKTVERAVQQIKSGANPLTEIGEVLKSAERSSNNPQQFKQEVAKAQQVIETAAKQQPVSSDISKSEAIKEVRQAIQAEPNAQKAINYVKQQVLDNPGFDAKTKQQVERAVTESNRILSAGQPGLAKGQLVQSLVPLENTMPKEAATATKLDAANKPSEPIQSLSKTVERAVQQIKNGANPLTEVREVLKSAERSTNNPQQLKQEIAKAQQVIETATKQQQPIISETSKAEAIKEVRRSVQTEPNAQKAINHVKQQVLESPSFDPKTKQQVERAVTEANRLLSANQPGLAKGQLVQSLVTVENNLAAEKAVVAKVEGSVSNKAADPNQTISRTVEQAVQQIKSGANPAKEIEKVLTAVEKKNVENTPQLRQEIAKSRELLAAEKAPVDQGKHVNNQGNKEAEVIKQVRETVRAEMNQQKAIQHVKSQIVDSPDFDMKTRQQVERAITESNRLLSAGQPGMAKESLVQSLAAIENFQAIDKVDGTKAAPRMDNVTTPKTAEPAQQPPKTAIELPTQQRNEAANDARVTSSHQGTDNQQLAKTIQQTLQSLRNGSDPVKEIDQVMKAVENKSAEGSSVLRKEIGDAKTILNEMHNAIDNTSTDKNQTRSASDPSKTLSESFEKALQQIKSGLNPAKQMETILSEIDQHPDQKVQQLKAEVSKAMQIQEAGRDRLLQASELLSGKDAINKTVENSTVSAAKEAIQQGNAVKESVQKLQQEVAKVTDMPADVKGKANQALSEGAKLHEIGTARLAESLKSLSAVIDGSQEVESEQNTAKLQASLKEMLKEPSMPKLFDKANEIVKEHSGNKDINFTDFKSSTEKAKQLNDQGRELAARKMVAEAVNKLEKDHPVLQNNAEHPALTDSDKFAINETLQTLGLESKVMQVTEISKKLSQMAIDFKKVKQDITKNLDNISMMLDKKVNSAQVKQMLDTTINKLDNAILKSNFMLYTDMMTEKKMLKASSQLAEARSLMAKGELAKASEIVKEVKSVLDRIIFKPSTTRVQNLVSEQSLMKQPVSTEEQLAYGIKQAVRPMPDQDYSSRQVFESLKRLGLTHENDAANSLVFGSKGEGEELNNNLKSALIKMVSEGEGQAKAEHALSNLTGQQLLNKQDSSGMQNLFFQMPFLLDQKMENIKVFINSQKSGEKIDWENCNLYFVLETKKLGEIGILVTAQNKNLSITFNSNKEDLQQTLGPLTEISAERLQEIGYRLEAIKVKKPSETTQDGTSADMKGQTLTPAFTEKGYDFSI